MAAGKWKISIACLTLALTAAVAWKLTAGGAPSLEKQRETLTKNHKDGNYKDAYIGLRKLALDPKNDPMLVGKDLDLGVDCLRRLGKVDEVDEFRESVIAVHAKNWRLLETAAKGYVNPQHEHYGFIVAGKFSRGQKRGTGVRYVYVMPRDRIRALQLMQQGLDNSRDEKDKAALAQFNLNFANMLLNGTGNHEPWRLQYLSDL